MLSASLLGASFRQLLMAAQLIWLCACTSISVEAPAGRAEQRTYFGVVTVTSSRDAATESSVRQVDVRTVGLRVDAGVSAGYMRDTFLSTPMDCR